MAELPERVLCENSRSFEASVGKQCDWKGDFLESPFSSWEAKMGSALLVTGMGLFHAVYQEMVDGAKHPGPINGPQVKRELKPVSLTPEQGVSSVTKP